MRRGGLAALQGMLHVGDTVIGVNGSPLRGERVADALNNKPRGTYELTIARSTASSAAKPAKAAASTAASPAPLTEADVLACQDAWASAIANISKIYLEGGDFVGTAGEAAGALYVRYKRSKLGCDSCG